MIGEIKYDVGRVGWLGWVCVFVTRCKKEKVL